MNAFQPTLGLTPPPPGRAPARAPTPVKARSQPPESRAKMIAPASATFRPSGESAGRTAHDGQRPGLIVTHFPQRKSPQRVQAPRGTSPGWRRHAAPAKGEVTRSAIGAKDAGGGGGAAGAGRAHVVQVPCVAALLVPQTQSQRLMRRRPPRDLNG